MKRNFKQPTKTLSEAAVEQLLEDINPLLCKICHESNIPGYGFEDLKQELVEQVLVCLQTWDPNMDVKFVTYAYPFLYHKRNMLARSVNAQSRGRGAYPISLNQEEDFGGNKPVSLMSLLADHSQNPEEYVELMEIRDIVYATLEATRSEKAKRILRDVLDGYTQVETCERNHCAQSLVSYHFSMFRTRLGAELMVHGYTVPDCFL